jgi:hypothetical protein
MKSSPGNFKKMMKLLTDLNLQGRRHHFAYRQSGGRTESTRELHDDEILAIIRELEVSFGAYDPGDKMRKKIISKAHQMHWQINGKADMARIDNWCVAYGPYKKPLNAHNIKELGILISVFDKVYRHYMNKI